MTQPSELVVRAQGGDRDAFGDLVRKHRGLVFAVCFDQTGSLADSEELTQEVFLAAYRGLASLREPDKLAPWLQGIARNLARMHRRRPGPDLVALPDQEAPAGGAPSAIRSLERQDLLHEALLGVTERSREVLSLHYLDGYSYREIGALCGLPPPDCPEPAARGASPVEVLASSAVRLPARAGTDRWRQHRTVQDVKAVPPVPGYQAGR